MYTSMKKLREGVISTGLGTAVTAAGATLVSLEIAPIIAAGVVGFGLAHIVHGTIDLAILVSCQMLHAFECSSIGVRRNKYLLPL